MFCRSPVLASLSIEHKVSEQKSMVLRSPTVCDDDAAVFFSPRSSCDASEFFDADDTSNSSDEEECCQQPVLSHLHSSPLSLSDSDTPSTDFGSSAGTSEAALSSDSEAEVSGDFSSECRVRERSVSSSSLGSSTACSPHLSQPSQASAQALVRAGSTSSASSSSSSCCCPRVARTLSNDDKEVVRGIRSTLNKLTVEKFDRLYEQLVAAGLQTGFAVELLVREVFEKASSQHHFLPMYTDLCVRLHDDRRVNEAFAGQLLQRCFQGVRELLAPSSASASASKEADVLDEEAKLVRKIGAMGNIKFLGHLSIRGFLPQAEVRRLCESLLESQRSCREALEALAALLTVIGPSPALAGGDCLDGIWEEVERLSKDKVIAPRDRFLLRDALDLRKSNASSKAARKATLAPDPTTLRAARREAPSLKKSVKGISSQAPTLSLSVTDVTAKTDSCSSNTASTTPSPENLVLKSLSAPAATSGGSTAQPQAPPSATPVARMEPGKFNKRTFRKVLAATMRDLTSGGSAIPEAVRIIREAQVPVECQTSEFVDILTRACEENRGPLRRLTFAFIGGLCSASKTSSEPQRGAFEVEACLRGVALFFEEVYGDLLGEVPRLQVVVESEMLPTLASILPAEALRNIVPKGISYHD